MTQEAAPLLRVENLATYYPIERGLFRSDVSYVRAVDGVSFVVNAGETVGLVGESGCGKSTVGRSILNLVPITSGKVEFLGRDLASLDPDALRALRRDAQIIFQDPFSSLNPRMRVQDIVGEALKVHGIASGDENRRLVSELLQRVGVPASALTRYPHEFSGGQRQRVGIARALALQPKLIVCDEAVSALDVSIRAQVLNLLIELRRELGLAYLFISHDLSVVRHVSDRVHVMYLGQIVESAPTEELFTRAAHPYTRALLSAIPEPDPKFRGKRVLLSGDVPSALSPPSGCRFHTRCPAAFERCAREEPPLFSLSPQRDVRCWLAEGHDTSEPSLAALHKTLSLAEEARAAEPEVVQMLAELPRNTASDHTAGQSLAAWRGTGLALLGLGSLLLLRGRWSEFGYAGFLGFGLGYVALRSSSRWSRRWDALLAVWLVVCAALGVRATRAARLEQAQLELSQLTRELDGYRKVTGNLPQQLQDLGYRLGFVFPHGKPLDPWGTPYDYRTATSSSGAQSGPGYSLRSLGPDGVPSTDDLK